MVNRVQRRREARAAGYTLIELVVVVVVLGLLAAVIIPSFLGQRRHADDAAATSLIRNAAITVEARYAEAGSYSGLDASIAQAVEPNIAWVDGPGATTSGNQVSIEGVTADTYVLTTATKGGKVFSWAVDRTVDGGRPSRTCGAGCDW